MRAGALPAASVSPLGDVITSACRRRCERGARKTLTREDHLGRSRDQPRDRRRRRLRRVAGADARSRRETETCGRYRLVCTGNGIEAPRRIVLCCIAHRTAHPTTHQVAHRNRAYDRRAARSLAPSQRATRNSPRRRGAA
ncbi:hypothetical protein A33M_2560 [Rhodovulum sp. PH10]|nr:hypothetical protein A33M_2560 [Rhodovulum sp. PH10]